MTQRLPKSRTRHGAVRAEDTSVWRASNIIEAAERFMAHRPTKTGGSASIIRPDFRPARPTPRALRRKLGPSLKRLPFVTIKQGGPRAGVKRYWNDVPTGNGRDDFKRGKKYAALTIDAMTEDGCTWYLERILEAIVADAVSRRAKGGKHSRTLPPAVDGFIHELSRRFGATIAGIQPAG
jgi:hypothetical protein